MPFLTDLDSRARIKGSRDPLGIQAIWVYFGRKVIGNLTTVSGSVRGFTTTLLGYHFVQEIVSAESRLSPLEVFLKFEQLAAYSRYHVNRDDEFRGVERVKERLARGVRVTLSADQRHQILSNQKIYGLWGLFSTPARTSGLVKPDEAALTPVARNFVVAEYLSRLNQAGLREGKAIADLLRMERAELDLAGRHAAIGKAVAALLRPTLTTSEQAFYRHHLAHGGDTDRTEGRQRHLAQLLLAQPSDSVLGAAMVRRLVAQAQRRGTEWQGLAARLTVIAKLEALLAPAANLFDFLLARQGVTISKLGAEVGRSWGPGLRHLDLHELEGLHPEIGGALGDAEAGTRWLRVAQALARGDYEATVRLLVDQNAAVMSRRAGSPWVRLTHDRFEIRFREETGSLASRPEVPSLWRHSYFLDSLYTVVQTLEARK